MEWALSAGGLVGSPTRATDTRGPLASRANKRTHHVEIARVAAGSTVHYNVVSGGKVDPNGPYQAPLPSNILITPPNLVTGRVFYEDGSPGQECLVYVRVTQVLLGTLLGSLWVGGLTDGGGYTIDVTNIRQDPGNPTLNDFDRALQYDVASEDATITVAAMCGLDQVGLTVATTAEVDAGVSGIYQLPDILVPGL